MLRFTRHALEVMTERGIPVAWVRRALETPDSTEPDPGDPALTRAFVAIPERDERVLRVVYSEDEAGLRVITAFLDRGRRR